MRSITTVEDDKADKGITTVIRLQGDIDFNAAEKIWRAIREREFESNSVILDLDKVDEINAVGGRMVREFRDRMIAAGMDLTVVDSDGVLAQ